VLVHCSLEVTAVLADRTVDLTVASGGSPECFT